MHANWFHIIFSPTEATEEGRRGCGFPSRDVLASPAVLDIADRRSLSLSQVSLDNHFITIIQYLSANVSYPFICMNGYNTLPFCSFLRLLLLQRGVERELEKKKI